MTVPTGILFDGPQDKPTSTIGLPQAGCYRCFFLTGTTTLANVYADGLQTTPLSQPTAGSVNPSGGTVADASGRFVPIYLNPAVIYRVQLYSAAGIKLEDTDPYVVPGIGTAASMGAILFPQTPAEASAGVSVTNFAIPPYPINVLRYGVLPNDPSKITINTTILQTLFSPLVTNGPEGLVLFPNTTGDDIYFVGGVIPCRAGIHIDACGSTISLGQSGTPIVGISTDTGSGLFMAQNDFSFVNGTINIFWNTGPSTSSGNAFSLGFRQNDCPRWPLNPVYDSLLAIPQGGFKLEDVRVNSTITGPNVVGSAGVAMTGGIQGVDFRNLYIQGSGTGGMSYGIFYEFGWATSGTIGDTGQSSRQTSHMHNAHFTNINVTNMDNVAATSGGIVITGAYSCFFDGIYVSGCSNGISCQPGEAQYYRPWAGVDTTTGPTLGVNHAMILRNIVVVGASNAGVSISGTGRPTDSTYLHVPWVANTVYVAGQTVKNNGNMYVTAAGGTSAASGGPSGTGSAITDNTVTWAYVDLNRFTDLIDFSLDGFAITCIGTGNAIFSQAGYAAIRNGFAGGGSAPVTISEETTRFDIDGVIIHNGNSTGLSLAFTASAVWSPARLKKGIIRNCFIAGNSQGSVGASGAITIQNFDGVLIENCRFGYEAAYSFLDETTQGQAVFLPSTTAGANANLRIRGCRVGGAVGNIGFVNQSSTANQGNIVENCTFNQSGPNPASTLTSGAWMTDFESLTAPTLASSGTITTNGLKTSRVSPAGAVTGVVLQVGSYQCQEITVINEATAANSVTFAASGTSHVADGTGDVIAGVNARKFTWDTGTSLWYPNK